MGERSDSSGMEPNPSMKQHSMPFLFRIMSRSHSGWMYFTFCDIIVPKFCHDCTLPSPTLVFVPVLRWGDKTLGPAPANPIDILYGTFVLLYAEIAKQSKGRVRVVQTDQSYLPSTAEPANKMDVHGSCAAICAMPSCSNVCITNCLAKPFPGGTGHRAEHRTRGPDNRSLSKDWRADHGHGSVEVLKKGKNEKCQPVSSEG